MLHRFVLLALIAPALAAPASAGADGGNVALSQSAIHMSAGSPAWDLSTPLVINHEGRIDYTVTNSGGIPATVTFHLDGTSSGTTSLPVFWAAVNDQSRTCTFPPWTLPVTCTRQLAAGASWTITLEALAYTPGTLDLDASITTEGANDNPADDHLSATISTRCSIIGTTGKRHDLDPVGRLGLRRRRERRLHPSRRSHGGVRRCW